MSKYLWPWLCIENTYLTVFFLTMSQVVTWLRYAHFTVYLMWCLLKAGTSLVIRSFLYKRSEENASQIYWVTKRDPMDTRQRQHTASNSRQPTASDCLQFSAHTAQHSDPTLTHAQSLSDLRNTQESFTVAQDDLTCHVYVLNKPGWCSLAHAVACERVGQGVGSLTSRLCSIKQTQTSW